MGRLLEGFGVGIISYVVSVIKLHPWLFSAHRRFMAWELEYLWCLSCTNEKKKQDQLRYQHFRDEVIYPYEVIFIGKTTTMEAWTGCNT
jgi:uncharacterized membrane protein